MRRCRPRSLSERPFKAAWRRFELRPGTWECSTIVYIYIHTIFCDLYYYMVNYVVHSLSLSIYIYIHTYMYFCLSIKGPWCRACMNRSFIQDESEPLILQLQPESWNMTVL